MHEMQTTATGDPGCGPVCHLALLCKHGYTYRGPALGGDSWGPTQHCICIRWQSLCPSLIQYGLQQDTLTTSNLFV